MLKVCRVRVGAVRQRGLSQVGPGVKSAQLSGLRGQADSVTRAPWDWGALGRLSRAWGVFDTLRPSQSPLGSGGGGMTLQGGKQVGTEAQR